MYSTSAGSQILVGGGGGLANICTNLPIRGPLNPLMLTIVTCPPTSTCDYAPVGGGGKDLCFCTQQAMTNPKPDAMYMNLSGGSGGPPPEFC
jgi:hypothetical protein